MQVAEDCESMAEEWRRLCSRLRGKANQAIATTKDDSTKRAILVQVERFCRDVPPNKALLSALAPAIQ